MQKRIHTLSALVSAFLIACLPYPALAEISAGSVLASTCFTCHGTDGKSTGSIPSIYGIPAETLVRNMKAFQSGERPSTVMARHARGYTDEEIRIIANYLSAIE